MFRAISGALSLAAIILVLQLFLPEVAARLIELIVKLLEIALYAVDQAQGQLPS